MNVSQSAAFRSIIAIAVALILLLAFRNRSEISNHVCRGVRLPTDHVDGGQRLIPKTFIHMPSLENMSHENDETWTSTLMPPNEGFISVKHNESLNLDMGISMFHSLHCLSLVRAILQNSAAGDFSPAHQHLAHDSRGNAKSEHFLWETHLPHCLIYLAQSIICAGDSTIEPPWLRTDDAGNIVLHGVDGLGVQHQCKDTSLLWDVSRNRAMQP